VKFGDWDLLLGTTRCPLHDHLQQEQQEQHNEGQKTQKRTTKRILRSKTPLENDVFHTLETVFLWRCDRTKIELTSALREALRPYGLDLGNYDFRKTNGDVDPNKIAVGFLFYAPYLLQKPASDQLEKEPPATCKPKAIVRTPKFLLSFAMGASENAIWARALRLRHADLLSEIIKSKQFWVVLGTWDPTHVVVPDRPGSLSFADKIKTKIVVLRAEALDEAAPASGTRWKVERFDR
jgi:hypothetical protein